MQRGAITKKSLVVMGANGSKVGTGQIICPAKARTHAENTREPLPRYATDEVIAGREVGEFVQGRERQDQRWQAGGE